MKKFIRGPYTANEEKIKEHSLVFEMDPNLEFNLDDNKRIANQNEIESLLLSTKRDGIEDLINWLRDSGFYKDPASARFHLCCEGGLAEHSLNVYHTLEKIVATGLYGDIDKNTMIITALLHDICKVGTYSRACITNKSFTKDYLWATYTNYDGYANDDKFPIGHGEKSIILAQKYIKLTDEEILMIRYHMGAFSDSAQERTNFGRACSMCPSVLALETADITASNVIEAKYGVQD